MRNVLTDRIEAMKVVLADLAGRSDFVSPFKTLAGLDHPNIAAGLIYMTFWKGAVPDENIKTVECV